MTANLQKRLLGSALPFYERPAPRQTTKSTFCELQNQRKHRPSPDLSDLLSNLLRPGLQM